MVHALREAHRVLQPEGLLLDLRPGAVHRRVGIEVDGQYRQCAIMEESLQDDYAANRAVAEVIRRDWYKPMARIQVNCHRVMALKDFPGWLTDFPTDRDATQERLIRRVERAFREAKGRTKKIVVTGPLVLRLLKRLS